MPISPFMAAINQIADEKGLPKDSVIEAVEAALAAAYRKDYAHPENVIRARLSEDSEDVAMSQVFTVVTDEEFENEFHQMTLEEARKHNPKAEIGDEIEIAMETQRDFGRIAAQTAKQVIIQRIREAERELLFSEFKDKEHQVVTGSVQQVDGDSVYVNLGKISALMMQSDQLPSEQYYVGQRLKVFVTGVEETPRGPRVLVSRAHPELVSQL
ncbi:MAG TPA: NusA N-terminal domain-containing protein, partial [Patescibacteria group bacterium]